jgi:HSP20 family molecular chaperone IbpA
MREVSQALHEVKDLYTKVLGQPAPEIGPGSYAEFPPGVDPVEHAFQEVDQLQRLADELVLAPDPAAWTPRADSFLAPDAFVVRMEIPGVDRENLKVFVVGSECVVRGEIRAVEEAKDLRPVNLERPWGRFERRFALPPGTLPDRVTARQKDGLLELRVRMEGTGAGVRAENQVKVA